MNVKVAGLVAGTVFGFVISWAGLTDPGVIRNMLLLREAHVFLLMGSAIVVAGVGVRALRGVRAQSSVTHERINWSATPVERKHVAGSAIVGAGWSIACTCPGPVAAMIGQGHFSGVVVGAGLLAGIALKHRIGARAPAPVPTHQPHAAGL